MKSITLILVAILLSVASGASEDFRVGLGRKTQVFQGQGVHVPLELLQANRAISKFRFTIGFDSTYLTYDSFQISSPLRDYATAFNSSVGRCDGIPGVDRAVTITADFGKSGLHRETPTSLGKLVFRVSGNYQLHCTSAFVRFVWPQGCSDNHLEDVNGGRAYTSPVVIVHDSVTLASAWSTRDLGLVCPERTSPKSRMRSLIQFVNGALEIACAESLSTHMFGPCRYDEWDIGYSLAEAVRGYYIRYYVYAGRTVTGLPKGGQAWECLTREGDRNGDGRAPTLEDFALVNRDIYYNYRGVTCDTPLTAHMFVDNDRGKVSIFADCVLGALLIEFGDSLQVTPGPVGFGLAQYARPCTTRVLLYGKVSGAAIPNGELFSFDGEVGVTYLEAVSFDGKPVTCSLRVFHASKSP